MICLPENLPSCKERDEIVEVESAEAGSAVEIITPPTDAEVEVGETAVYTVEANNVVSYQWQWSSNDGATWGTSGASGNKTNTLRVVVTEGNKGFKLVGLKT